MASLLSYQAYNHFILNIIGQTVARIQGLMQKMESQDSGVTSLPPWPWQASQRCSHTIAKWWHKQLCWQSNGETDFRPSWRCSPGYVPSVQGHSRAGSGSHKNTSLPRALSRCYIGLKKLINSGDIYFIHYKLLLFPLPWTDFFTPSPHISMIK